MRQRKLKWTPEIERICLENIQSYLDAIYNIENGNHWAEKKDEEGLRFLPDEICETCNSVIDTGKETDIYSFHPLNFIDRADALKRLKARLKWLLAKYKRAGLDVEIVYDTIPSMRISDEDQQIYKFVDPEFATIDIDYPGFATITLSDDRFGRR